MPTTKTAEKNDDKGERKENEKKRRQQLGRRKNKITKKLGKNSVALGSYRATGVHPHVSPYPPPLPSLLCTLYRVFFPFYWVFVSLKVLAAIGFWIWKFLDIPITDNLVFVFVDFYYHVRQFWREKKNEQERVPACSSVFQSVPASDDAIMSVHQSKGFLSCVLFVLFFSFSSFFFFFFFCSSVSPSPPAAVDWKKKTR